MSNTEAGQNGDVEASSTPSFVAALVTAAITVGAFTAAWLILHSRKELDQVIQPRTERAPKSKRPDPLPSGILGFWRKVFSVSDEQVVVANGLDAYFFLRFLRVFGLELLIPYIVLTFAICIPVS